MNHRWENNTCVKCGVKRKIRNDKVLMAIVNHPPWEAYRYRRFYIFSFNGEVWQRSRPSCKILNEVKKRTT